jgi:hypothetical protein
MMSNSINFKKNSKPNSLKNNAQMAIYHTIEIIPWIWNIHCGAHGCIVLCTKHTEQGGENQPPNERRSFARIDFE